MARKDGLVLACIAVAGCVEDDEDPRIAGAELLDARTIRLTFSETVSLGNVDPSSFRLSIAVSTTQSTYYYALDWDYYDGYYYGTSGGVSDGGDPTYPPPDGDGGPGGYGTSGGYYGTSGGYYGTTGDYYVEMHPTPELTLPIPTQNLGDLSVIELRGIDDTHKDLVLRDPITDRYLCAQLEALQLYNAEAGLMLHYKPKGDDITDTDGNPLAPIGAHWLDTPGRHAEVQGVFPNLRPKISIRCG